MRISAFQPQNFQTKTITLSKWFQVFVYIAHRIQQPIPIWPIRKGVLQVLQVCFVYFLSQLHLNGGNMCENS